MIKYIDGQAEHHKRMTFKEGKNMFKKIFLFIGLTFILLFITGCSSATGSYTANTTFSTSLTGSMQAKSAAYEGPYRNPVVIVNGFLGANLLDEKSGDTIWNAKILKNGYSLSDSKIRALAIPMDRPKKFNNQKTRRNAKASLLAIKPTGGIKTTSNPYPTLVKVLHGGGYQLEGKPLDPGKHFYTLFQFSYDWRHDLQKSAVKLHEYLKKKKKYLQQQYEKRYGIKDFDVQFDLIAYGTGGLISRYYLRFGVDDFPAKKKKPQITWAGSKNIDRLIMLGTPNAGYLDSFIEMLNGTCFPTLPPALLSTWPSYYQMMPESSTNSVVYRKNYSQSIDIYDPKTWSKMKWGLLNPNQDKILTILLPNIADKEERLNIATDHLQKCLERAKRFKEIMGVPATPPDDVKLYIFSGNAVKTTKKVSINARTGRLNVSEYGVGDGKALETSAIFDKRAGAKWWAPVLITPITWSGIYHVRAAHMGITKTPFLKDNIIELLRNSQKYPRGI